MMYGELEPGDVAFVRTANGQIRVSDEATFEIALALLEDSKRSLVKEMKHE